MNLACTFAQNGTGFIGNGYYRIYNYATNRYIYVTDNKDYFDKSHEAEDFQGIQLWKDANRAVPDPASVLYIDEVSSNTFDLKAQGTGVHSLTGYYVSVQKKKGGTYEVSASAYGVIKYLTDDATGSSAQGKMGTSRTGDYRKWVIDKIETDHASNYFGIKPTIQFDGKFYHPFYADFPFKVVSEDMHIYIVDGIVAGNVASMKEITGEIPANTPVIIECASANPSDNRLELLHSTSATVTGNKLSGVYFCNGKRPKASTDAYTKFDASKMRVLSVKNGYLVLTNDAPERLNEIKTVDWDTYEQIQIMCLPANTSYYKAKSSTPDVLLLTTDPDAIGNIHAENKEATAEGVYSISGTRLRKTNDTQGLPAGVYIVGGKKVAIK